MKFLKLKLRWTKSSRLLQRVALLVVLRKEMKITLNYFNLLYSIFVEYLSFDREKLKLEDKKCFYFV